MWEWVKRSWLQYMSDHMGPSKKEDIAPWMVLALKELGVAEMFGPVHNKKIIEYHQATTLKANDDETSWCASFANWVLENSGYESTKSAAARSFLNNGKIINHPEYGAIVILKRGTKSWQGHVGFVHSWDDKRVYVLGGNQSNKVSIVPFSRSAVLGYRKPVRKQS